MGWAVRAIDLMMPVEDAPVFTYSIDKHLVILSKMLYSLADPALQPAIAVKIVKHWERENRFTTH